MELSKLNSQKILITGPENELGYHLSKQLSSYGAQLILLTQKAHYLASLDDEIQSISNIPPIIIEFDRYRANETGFKLLADNIAQNIGNIHSLIHCELNAHDLTPILNTNIAQWQKCYQDYFQIPFALTHSLLPLLKQSALNNQNACCIFSLLNNAVSAQPFFGPIGAAQSALLNFQQTLSHELRESGMRFESVYIDDIRCAQQRHFFPARDMTSLYAPDSPEIIQRYLRLLC